MFSTLDEELEIVSTAIKGKENLDNKGRMELSSNLESFWKPKLGNMINSLRKSQGIKAIYFGGETASYAGKRRHLLFLSLTGLYCDKVLVRDPFLEALRYDNSEYRYEALIGAWLVLNYIKEANLDWVVVVPPVGAWNGEVCDQIINMSERDSRNGRVRKSVLYKQPKNEFWVAHRNYLLAGAASELKLPLNKLETLLVRDIAFDVNSVLLESRILDTLPMTDHIAFCKALGTIVKQRFKIDTTKEIDRTVLEGIMHLDLPIIKGEIPLEQIGELRMREGEAFREFRQALRECFDDLKGIESSTQLQKRASQVKRDIIDPAMKRLDSLHKKLRARATVSGVSFGVTTVPALISAICGNYSVLLASVIPSVISGLNFAMDMLNLNDLKGNQFYFLWKLQR